MSTTKTLSPDWFVLQRDMLASAGNYFFDAWAIMIVLSTIHGADHAIPNLGYWNCLLIVWGVQCLLGTGLRLTFERLKTITPTYGKKVGSPIAEMAQRLADLSKGVK
jgi:hypothetical protein